MKKIAIIGVGGINSWVVKHLKDVTKEFDKDEMVYVKLFDKDEVEEKNLLRSNQNFKIEDLMLKKAEVLGKRYNYDYENIFITEKNLDILSPFNDIILGVDNHKTRRLLYKYCLENNKYLLDMRAQGTQISFYLLNHTKTIEYYDKKYFNNQKVMERKGSCQLEKDIKNDHIENGNKSIAYFGMYCIYLKQLRGEKVSTYEWKFIY